MYNICYWLNGRKIEYIVRFNYIPRNGFKWNLVRYRNYLRLKVMWTLVCFAHWSFSLIRKMEMGETINHPLCGCASIVIQKNYLSVYNKVVQAILQKGKVIYGEERIFTRQCIYFYKCLLKNSSAKNHSTFFLTHNIIIEC